MMSMQELLQQRQQFGDPYAQPSTLGSIVGALPPSPYGQAAAANPGLVNDTAGMVDRLTSPQQPMFPSGAFDDQSAMKATQPGTLLPAESGMAYGQPSSFTQTGQGQPNDGMSVVDDIKAVVGLPFGLLNAGRNVIQDTLNLPGAQQRQQSAAMLQAFQNLSPSQKQMLGIPSQPGIQTASQMADPGTAKGAPSSLGGGVQSTQPGFFEWAKNLGRDKNQQQMNQIAGAIQANYMAGKMTEQQAKAAAEIARVALTQAQTIGETTKNAWIDPLSRAELGQRNAAAGASRGSERESDAHAGLYGAQAKEVPATAAMDRWATQQRGYASQGQGDTSYSLLPGKVAGGLARNDLTAQAERNKREQAVQSYGNPKNTDEQRAAIAAAGELLTTDVPNTGLLAGLERFLGRDAGTHQGLDVGALTAGLARSPSQPPQTARDQDQGGVAGVQPQRAQPSDVNNIYSILRRGAGVTETAALARAREIAALVPTLDRSSQAAFHSAAKAAGLTRGETELLWAGY